MPYIHAPDGLTNNITDVYNSSNVFANFIPVALWDNPQGTGVASAINFELAQPDYAVTAEIIEAVEGSTDEAAVIAQQQVLIAEGKITQASITAGVAAATNPANSDPVPAPATATTGTTTGATTLDPTVDNTVLYVSALTGITYTVATVTKQPGVVFPYDVATVAPQNGYTVQEVCDNLRLLIINCFDPIKNKYPDAFMTCSFRKAGVGSTTSQHPKGMACDIQYSKASKADYFTRAQWVRDNTQYDQFILEFKTTGTGNPWHHISFNKAGNKAQVLTFMNDRNAKGPGVTGLYDLSNA